MIAFDIIVYGIVQGVGFRYFTKQKADELQIFGSVMNNDNGTVVIHVEGLENEVMEFIAWCHDGPQSATVEKLEYESAKINDVDSFEIKR